MTLHIFNPEHDIALAANLANFTAPHAGRQLRHDLGFLPALWAGEADKVLVDDAALAVKTLARLVPKLPGLKGRKPAFWEQLFCQWPAAKAMVADGVEPWGWNRALCRCLERLRLPADLMPSAEQLERLRNLSHRRTAAALLPRLRTEGTVGESFECSTVDEVEALLRRYGQLVLKAPWSSSGRGLRFLGLGHTPLALQEGWLRNVLRAQGSVMAEPYYNKVKDFGMEFHVDARGEVCYLGLSLFHTQNGAYTGNLLATEVEKRRRLGRYLPLSLIDEVESLITQQLGPLLCGQYQGPLGIDMMVVAGVEGFLLHPCVEINLRRTMGHVALCAGSLLNPGSDDELVRVMRIVFEDNCYKLRLQRL